MMKIIFFFLFMIPLSIFNYYWLIQWLFFFSSFIFLFFFTFSYYYIGISYYFGFDILTYLLILLSFWICALMILASEKILKSNFFSSFFLFNLIILFLFLFLTFSSMNLFVFYLFFEMSLIPTLFLIMGWGYQPERLQAGIYLLFYTLMASLPMMISIFYCYKINNSMDFNFLNFLINNVYLFICMNMVFFVKLPMFFVHLWLPKAHVEAPIAGSMILAGVLLKLGGYGLLRLMMMFYLINLKINIFFISLSLLGGFIISLVCIRQSDVKSLIAYSSVAHMGLVLCGILTLNFWGLIGSLVMMLAHGLCSSGLFCLANIVYERMYSRSLYLMKGLINILPSFSMWWFLLISSNMAAPPSMNLLGEIMLINSLIGFSSINFIFIMMISFFSAVYSLYLYSFSQHGVYYSGLFSFFGGVFREYLLLMLHWLPLNVIILKGEIFFIWL